MKDWQDIEDILHYQSFFYVLKIIRIELISRHYNNLLAGYFGIKKIRELIAQKYYWPMFCDDIDHYIKRYNICLASKTIQQKLYDNLQSLLVPIHCWEDILINFVTDLLI